MKGQILNRTSGAAQKANQVYSAAILAEAGDVAQDPSTKNNSQVFIMGCTAGKALSAQEPTLHNEHQDNPVAADHLAPRLLGREALHAGPQVNSKTQKVTVTQWSRNPRYQQRIQNLNQRPTGTKGLVVGGNVCDVRM